MNSDHKVTLLQPTLKVEFNINIDRTIVLEDIDDWLNCALDIETTDIEYIDSGTSHLAEALSWRILLVSRSFLQAVRLPCFDLGSIIKLSQDIKNPAKWGVTAHLVRIDNAPKELYGSVVNSAIKTIFWIIEKKKTPSHIKELHEIIYTKVIQTSLGTMGAGKSTIPILHTAHQENIPFIHLGRSVYQLGWGSRSRQIERSGIDIDSAIGAGISNNKMLSSNLFRMAGLPTPEHRIAISEKDAINIAHSLTWPIVVKPADTDRGEGVTVGIEDEKQLLDAFRSAQQLSKSKQVIIEREVEGVCHRLFVVNGKLLYAVKRLAKSVKGDGKKSVQELISHANQHEESKPPWIRDTLFPKDEMAIKALKKAGFTLNSIPAIGELAPLRMIESTASGGTFEEVTDNVHPDNLDIALRAARICGLGVAGIDIITVDIRIPWHQSSAIINEINFRPQLGGNEISKNYIPLFFKYLITDNGRIPIDVIIGTDQAMDMAINKQKSLIKKGINCFVTSHTKTFTGKILHEMFFPFHGLYKRCEALLIDRSVEAIILVIQTDEFLYTGLPFDQITSIYIAEGGLRSFTDPHKNASTKNHEKILSLLKSCTKT